MRIPYVIDNQEQKLADVLNGQLERFKGRTLDVASAFFNVWGFQLLQRGLENLGSFRLLLGQDPAGSEALGLTPKATHVRGLIERDLNAEPFAPETMKLVEDLIGFLRRDNVAVRVYEKGFLHAKAYLFYGDEGGQRILMDRLQPVLGVVGSSNFTRGGLVTNKELNLTHKVLVDEEETDDPQSRSMLKWMTGDAASIRIKPENQQLLKSEVGARAILELVEWYDGQWEQSRDFKDDLIELLDASKFGEKEYTPYEVYLKALYEYFREDLEAMPPQAGRTAVNLSEFQEDAVKKARKILAMYDGVMVADSVGLGKTWIGKRLLEDFAYHQRMKALVICPAGLRRMWRDELADATIAAQILSQEEMGREGFDTDPYRDADVILIDESHNFRNKGRNRRDALEEVIKRNGGLGRAGERKKIILLTATPINNDLFDLHNQIALMTQGDRAHFAGAGIGDLYKYFRQARKTSGHDGSGLALFNLLEEVVIRRSRQFVQKAYPEATIFRKQHDGSKKEIPVKFPRRRLKTEEYNLEATYGGIYNAVVSGVEGLKLAPYSLETYKKKGVEVDEWEEGRQVALVGIFKSRYLKRFESSVHAFRISVRRALEFQKTFESYILDGKGLKSKDFRRAMQFLEREDEEDDATPPSRADEIDEHEEARQILAEMEEVDPKDYDLRRVHTAVQHDIDVLTELWNQVKGIKPEQDAKLAKLKEILAGPLKGKKVLIFSYYKDTERYVHRELAGDNERGQAFLAEAGNPLIRRMDSGNHPDERTTAIVGFAPEANLKPEIKGTDKEIDILVSTDVLSEGQNLQDCQHMINYDLHWNPCRMVQRAGRIDRIGTPFDTLYIHNMFPDEGLERLLKIVERLMRKIAQIDEAGMLDASILGETVHPKSFNTLRRIKEEDGEVIEEEEQFAELASNESLILQLRRALDEGLQEKLDSLPDGIHSGLARAGQKGAFFYFRGEVGGETHDFWRYYDLNRNQIIDNRYLIANLIACDPDTPRAVGDYDVFELQEKVIADILRSFEEQQGLEATPATVDPVQQTVATTLQGYLNHPDLKRPQVLAAIKYVNTPMMRTQIKQTRELFDAFKSSEDIVALVTGLVDMSEKYGVQQKTKSRRQPKQLTRDDLRLICFGHLCS